MNNDSLQGAGKRRVLFVLGSGVSSGICPNVEGLTNNVLSPDPKWFGYDQADEFQAIVGFLNVLQREARPTIGECTYEDLFSMCDQLTKWELNEIRDPAFRLFRNQVYAESQKHWKFYDGGCYNGELPLAAIAQKAQHAIHVVIRNALVGKTEPKKQLDLITETISLLGSENVDILTLNHDCLVEALLNREDIGWTDGFDPVISQDGDLINFDAAAFENKNRVRIVKLHGGCDWHYAGVDQHTFRWVKTLALGDIDFCKDSDGEKFYEHSMKAPTLTGTTTKALAYTEGIYAELYIEARRLLGEYDRIVCSGYGWNDYGFNTMLREWGTDQKWHLDQRRYPRLLLLHQGKHIQEFKTEGKAMRRNLLFWPDNWEKDPSEVWSGNHRDWMRYYPKWFSCTRFENIEHLLFS